MGHNSDRNLHRLRQFRFPLATQVAWTQLQSRQNQQKLLNLLCMCVPCCTYEVSWTLLALFVSVLLWGTRDSAVNIVFADNPELSKVLSWKTGITSSFTARIYAYFPSFQAYSTSSSQIFFKPKVACVIAVNQALLVRWLVATYESPWYDFRGWRWYRFPVFFGWKNLLEHFLRGKRPRHFNDKVRSQW